MTDMRKLNFGCGARYARGWVNIDFHSECEHVQRVNLLEGLPFPEGSFDVVYSSHVVEHFARDQAAFLVREAYRTLKTGGIVRVVVPDLEGSCREYLRILAMDDGDPTKGTYYEWIVVELLDQLVRTRPAGHWGPLSSKMLASGDDELVAYILSRADRAEERPRQPLGLWKRLMRLTPERLGERLVYKYLRVVARLVPVNLRDMVFVQTGIGERHRWMYDRYSLRELLRKAGFSDIKQLEYDDSEIPGFNADHLDCNSGGDAYKRNSLYFEGKKPTK